jgi:hypothetical protein
VVAEEDNAEDALDIRSMISPGKPVCRVRLFGSSCATWDARFRLYTVRGSGPGVSCTVVWMESCVLTRPTVTKEVVRSLG